MKLRCLRRTFIVAVVEVLAQDRAERFSHVFYGFGHAGKEWHRC